MSRAALAGAALLAALWCAPAAADPRLPRPSEEAVRQAREHFERGMARYNLGDFDAAIGEFRLAYEQSAAPGLLFNLAQAYRLKHEPGQALYLYQTYLRLAPDAPNRVDAERWVAELETRPPPPTAQLAPPPVGQVAPPTATARLTASSPGPRPGRALRIAGVSLTVAGLVLLATGIALGIESDSAATDLRRLAMQKGMWSANARDTYDNGRREAAAATALDAIGAVAVGTGGLLAIFGWRSAPTTRALVKPGGAVVMTEWRF